MKFRYIGTNENMTVFGYDFSGGLTPDVTDAVAIAKLSGNSHFVLIKEDKQDKRRHLPAPGVIGQVEKAAAETESEKLPEGEDRKPAPTAIEKRQ